MANSLNKYCDTSKLSIRKIDKASAKKMVVKHHYSKLWTKCSVALGLFYQTGNEHAFFDEPEEKLIGVCVYGDPIGRLSGQSISDLLDRTQVLELTRLFVHDGYGSNIESWFISQSFKWLKKNFSSILALMSYSDPKEGHAGTIYQATNWIYQGNKIRPNDSISFKFSPDGRWTHGRTIFPYYGTNKLEKIREQVTEPFWVRTEPRKHRYIYLLAGKKIKKNIMNTLKHPPLPYPKPSDIEDMSIRKLMPK